MYNFTEEQGNAILNYLGSKPFVEVQGLIKMIFEATKPAEKKPQEAAGE